MTQLTEHFTLEEFVKSDTATRLAIDNTPPDGIVDRLRYVMAPTMETIRAALGGLPINVSSGYRCPALNTAINGSPVSSHMDGYACDFECPAYGTPQAICNFLVTTGLRFDQLIYEGTWVHIGMDPKMRQQTMTAHFGPGGTTYTNGFGEV